MAIQPLELLNPDALTDTGNASDGSRANVVPGLNSVDAGKILAWVQGQFEICRKARLQFEQDWYTNLAFYGGRQYVQWSPNFASSNGNVYQRLYEPKAPPWRVRLIANRIRSIIRQEHAKLNKENPQPFVMPASTDDTDVAAARAAENIYEFLWRDLKMKRVIRRTVWWVCLTGVGYIKDWYDPNSLDSSGTPGVIKAEVVTPFHIYVPEVDEEELENQPHVTHVKAVSPDFLQGAYGVSAQPDSNSGGAIIEQKFFQALGITQQGSGYNRCMVRETSVKPCPAFPGGAIITWLQDQLLSVTPQNPFEHREYMFTKFDHIPTGRFYGESVIKDLIPIQKEYNRTRSQMVEAKNKMAKPQLAAQKGSIDPNKVTSEPGLIVFYQPGFQPPTPIPLENLPSYVPQELERCKDDMADISSQHGVSNGQPPPGVTAATAISYLQEEDDSSLSNSIASLEEGIEKIGRHFLCHVQQFWDLPRTVRVEGSDGMYEAYVLSGADIAGNTDLNIQSGSAMPRSRAAKQAFIMELGKLQWIPPDRALRYLDMAETGRLYEELQRDARQAQRENIKMMRGMPVEVNTWDEHQTHVSEHNNKRKGQDFENAPDQVKMAFEQHVQMHQMAMQQQAMQLAQQQGMQQQIGGGGQQSHSSGIRQQVQVPPEVINQDQGM